MGPSLRCMHKDLQARLAEELRAELGRRRISGRSLAQAIGYPPNTVTRWLKDGTMTFNQLDIVCRAVGITVPDLFAAIERTGGYEPTPQRHPDRRGTIKGTFTGPDLAEAWVPRPSRPSDLLEWPARLTPLTLCDYPVPVAA